MESGFNVRVEEAIAVASQEGGDSVQNVNIVDAISEGPIKGLVGGEAGVFLNDIPAEYDEFRSFIPLQYTPSSADQVGTITFSGGSDVTGSVDANTTIPADLENNAAAPRLLILTYLTQEVTVSSTPSQTTAQGKTYTLTATSGTPFTTNSEGSEWDSSAREVNTRADIYREGEQYIGRTSYLTTSTISLTFKEGNGEGIEAGGTYTLRIYRFIPIVSIDPAQGIVTVETSNAPVAGTYNFGISKQPTQEEIDDANTEGRGNIAQKIDKLNVRLRTGTATQDPLTTIGGVGGSVSINGSVGAINLPQLKLINPDTNANTTGVAPIDAAGMPTDSSDFNDSATILSSNAFGLNAATVQEVDEISWSIRYNALQATSLASGKKERAYAFYVMQIALKKEGTGFGEWKDCFPNKGTYVTHYSDTSAPTQFDHSLTLEQFRPFVDLRVRIIRITRHLGLPVRADGTSGGETIKKDWQLSAVSSISSLGAEINDKFRYPYTALASLSFNSRQFQNTPKRSYLAEGLLVAVPSNYTPREYSPSGQAVYKGFWDGNFRDSLYYTDNPAWVFYDIIRNNRYGAGKWIEAGDIDKYALYRVARYCDELVDAGTIHNSTSSLIVGNFYRIKTAGDTTWSSVGSSANTVDTVFRATAEDIVGTGVAIGLEPRFRANIYLGKATDVYKVLKDMATIFLGILYWQDGQLTAVQDTPQDPVYSFSKANVIEGSFNYQTTGNRTKINQVIVTWNDPTINYEPAPLIIEDRESIARTGRIISESAVAFGATSEAQAFRYGKWKLWTAQNQTEIVSFKTALASSFIKPGDVISIQDANKTGLDHSGRIKAVSAAGSNTIITFDRDVDFSTGTYDLNILVTEPAAFWTGVDPLSISSDTYQSGDRVAQAYVDENQDGTSTLVDIDSDLRAASAFQDSAMTIPLALEWKDYTYVQTLESIAASGTTNQVTIPSSSLDATPVVGTIWGLKKTVDSLTVEGSSKNYKILSITQDSLTEASISAVEFYNEKFLAVEKDYELGTLPVSVLEATEGVSIPAPENVRVLINSNPAETGEELVLEWDAPSNPKFVAKYEVHHNIEGVASPIKTSTTNTLLTKIPDGLLQVKVRAISPKGNVSRYRFLEFYVGDPFNTNVTRVQEGIPKGIISNSKFSVNNLNELLFEVDPTTVVSLGDSLGGSRSITEADKINLAGIINTPNVDHHVLLDGNQLDLVHYDTLALEGIGFWRKIEDGQSHLTPLLSNWTAVSGSVTVAAGTNKITGTGTSFIADIKPRDIITFGTSKDLVPYSITAVDKTQTNVRVRFTSSIGGMLLDGSRAIIRGTAGSTELNDTYYFVDKISQTLSNGIYTYTVELHTTQSLNNPVLSSTVTTWTSGGTIIASPFAATVISVVNDTTLILDKTFDIAIPSTTLNRRTYRPSYSEDSIFAKISYDGSTFQLSKYITLDETLALGKQVLVNVSDPLLQYQFNSPNTQLTSPGNITATATAIGFKDPVFKVTSLSTNLDGDLDSTYQNPNVGNFGYSKIIDNGTIAYALGAPESIVIEAAEKFNNTLSITGTGVISKVTAGSDGISGKTVNITSEDLSIIYDEKGLNPVHNGTGSELDFTASSTNFTNPVYKFTVTPGTGVSTLTLTQTGTPDANGFYSASTATLTVPANHSTWNSAKKEASALISVQVAESGATGTVLATDQVIVRAIHALSGGFWTSFSNLSASIPTTSEGVPVGTAGTTAGHILGASTGTTIEVGKGSTILTYTSSGTPGIGQYTLTGPTSDPASALNAGTLDASNASLVSYGDAEFSTTAWTTDTATLTYNINVQNQATIVRTQVFTKSKEGFGGVTVLQTNPSESVPVDKNGTVTDFSVTANAVNLVSSSGVSIPFYVNASAANAAGASNWWTYGSSTPSNLGFPSTFDDEFSDTDNNGSTGFIDIGAATSMTADTASVTHSLVLHRGTASETFSAIQNISKNTNASNISATVTVPHYNYSSANVASPSGGYTLNWVTTSPTGTTEVVTVDGTTETGSSKTYNTPAYSSGSQITHTVRLYNGSVAAGNLLDTDIVTVSKSKDGTDGVSLTSTQEYYKLTNSATTPGRYSTGTTIDAGWSTTPPQPTSSNKYLWNFNRNTKSNGSIEDTNVILLSTLVKSIASITEAYQIHNSATSAPTGTWYSTIAGAGEISATNPYLWNRTTIAYTDGSTSTIVFSLIAARGDDGASAKVVQLTAADYSVVYNQDGGGADPTGTIALTASAQGFTSPRYKFTGDGVTDDTAYDNTTGSDTFTVPTTFFSSPKSIRVGVAEAAAVTTELAFDTITITAVKPGIDAEKNINLGLITSANISLDSTLEKVSKTADNNSWNGQVYSTVAYTGGAKVEFSPNQNNKYFMMGLNTDPATDANHTSIDYHWYCINDGTLRARVNNANAPGTPNPSYVAGDILSVVYDNDTVTWLQNGIVRLQLTAARNLKFHLDSSFYNTGTDQTKFFDFAPTGAAALSYTAICTNENHTFPAASTGTISSYVGSGTTFEAYRGSTRLQGISTGTPARGQFKVTAGTDTNITKSSTNGSVNGNDIVFGQHSNFTGTTGSIEYSINLENEITSTKKQTFTKASDGATGTSITGPDGEIAPRVVQGFVYSLQNTVAPDAGATATTYTFSTGAFTNLDSNWSLSPPSININTTQRTTYYAPFTAVEGINTGTNTRTDVATEGGSGANGTLTFGSITQGTVFTGLVTFEVDATNGNVLQNAGSDLTEIYGGNIKTGTIEAAALNLVPVESVAGLTGSTISSVQLSGAGISLTSDLGSLATQSNVNLATQVTGTLATGAGGTGSALGPFGYSTAANFISSEGVFLTSSAGDLATLDSIAANSAQISGLLQSAYNSTTFNTNASAAAPVQSVAGLDGIVTTTELESAGLFLQSAAGALATLDSVDATSAEVTGLLASATNQTSFDSAAGAAAPVQTSDITNFIELSGTAVTAGKIVLTTTGLIIDDGSFTVGSQSVIVQDTTGGNNAISIYDGGTLRVKLGKL